MVFLYYFSAANCCFYDATTAKGPGCDEGANLRLRDFAVVPLMPTHVTVPRRYFFCGSFMFLFCLVFAMSFCASVYMCFAVTCWERADLLALVCGV